MSGLLPPADDDAQPGKHHRKGEQTVPEHHETAAEDESVGGYYLDNKDWKAALSRYQSALVLDPDNPDVYWGLAEAERHLGNFADARANYQKVMDYDPGSHHAKEARKALQDPDLANAKPPQPRAASSTAAIGSRDPVRTWPSSYVGAQGATPKALTAAPMHRNIPKGSFVSLQGWLPARADGRASITSAKSAPRRTAIAKASPASGRRANRRSSRPV